MTNPTIAEALERLERAHDAIAGLTADSTTEERAAATAAFDAAERAHRLAAARSGSLTPPTTAPGGDADAPMLGPEQRMADWAAHRDWAGSQFTPDDARDFSLGRVMRALVDTRFRTELTDVEQRALSEGTNSAGGFLTPEPLSGQIIDKVRNAGQVFRAGATTVPLDSDQQSIPRLTGDPSGSWRAEHASFGTSNATFDRVTFAPKSYGFIVQTSEELYQDMIPGAERTIENAITQAAALELDRVALRGSGSGQEPTGILNQSGITKVLLGSPNGATPTPTNLMTGITALLNANRQPNAMIYAPRTSQTFASLVDTTGQPLRLPAPVDALDKYVTNQLPINITKGTSSDTSEIYEGYWPDLLVGIRLGIQLRLLTERYADTGDYAWRVFMRADIQLAHPESFYVLEGARP